MGSRREFLITLGALGAGVMGAGCNRLMSAVDPSPLPQDLNLPDPPDRVVRLLNRAAFGPTPGMAKSVDQQGVERWIEEQLAPGQADDPWLMASLARFEALSADPAELEDLQEKPVLNQLAAATVLRSVYSRWQVRERMVDFWTNHFNVFAAKAHGAYQRPLEDLKVIRSHALGRFSDLLRASSKSPGMLAYLDNPLNLKGRANENYARELMELHTLGVHGGYTQKDVMELARCLTGWGIEKRFLRHKGAFRFDPELHDSGPKTFLGHDFPPGRGIEDGEDALNLLANHPSTARFISQKLCRYFWGSAPESEVERTAKIFKEGQGDLVPVVRHLLTSEELYKSPPIAKRPYDYLVSALRATVAHTDGDAVSQRLSAMGQPLFGWPMPDGYPQKETAWTGSMLARWNFASELVSGAIPGTRARLLDHPDLTQGHVPIVRALLGREPNPAGQLEQALSKVELSQDHIALCLCAPEFQYR